MKIACIDIGTNSIRYLAVEVHPPAEPGILIRGLATPRLGEGLSGTGRLREEAINRTLLELMRIKTELESIGVSLFRCIGTEVLRLATNGDAFLRRAAELGFAIEILTGEEEARLIYAGATGKLNLSTRDYILADVGGGSTEIIIVKEGREPYFVSLPLGCVRLKELNSPPQQPRNGDLSPSRKAVRFEEASTDDPVVGGGVATISMSRSGIPPGNRNPDHGSSDSLQDNLMRKRCRDLLRENFPADIADEADTTLIGLGGTFTTLAAVSKGMTDYNGDRIHGSILTGEEIGRIGERLNGMTFKERKMVPGLEPSRADIIIYGIIIVESVMKHFGFTEVSISDYGILWGAVRRFENSRLT